MASGFFFGRLKGDWLKVSTTLRAVAGAPTHCADGLRFLPALSLSLSNLTGKGESEG